MYVRKRIEQLTWASRWGGRDELGTTLAPVERPKPRLSARTRNRERWRAIVTACAIVFGLAFATAVYFAVTGTELVDPSGRTLDCGSILSPPTSTLAAANCAGVSDGNVVGLIIAGVVAFAMAAIVVVRIARDQRGVHW